MPQAPAPDGSSDKESKGNALFGRYHEVLLIIFAFLLTTVCGGLMGYYFQNRSWENGYRQELLQDERDESLKVFEEVSCLMDKRLYKMRLLIWAYRDQESKEKIRRRWREHREILNEWNHKLNRNFALIQMYFGDRARTIFADRIHGSYRSLYKKLTAATQSSFINYQTLSQIENETDVLNNLVYFFDLSLLAAIKENNIGQFLCKEFSLKKIAGKYTTHELPVKTAAAMRYKTPASR